MIFLSEGKGIKGMDSHVAHRFARSPRNDRAGERRDEPPIFLGSSANMAY